MVETLTKIGMPLDEFIRESNDQMFELINGERKPKLPTVAGHNDVIRTLFLALYMHAGTGQLGEVFSEATFILPDAYDANWVAGSRTPDVMFYTGTQIADYKARTPDWRERPYPIVPDFVAEVVSPTDKYSDIDEKVDAYLLDGVRLIWLLDPQRRKTRIHTADAEQTVRLTNDARLDADEVIPGFQIALSKLFE